MDAYNNYNSAYLVEAATLTKQKTAIDTILAKVQEAIAKCSDK